MYEEYEYKSLRERMEDVEDDFVEALLNSPLFNNEHKNDKKTDINDTYTSIKIDEEDVLPF